MQPSKAFQEKMRVINTIQSEKGISKALALQCTAGRAIIHQWWEERALNSGRPTKMTLRALWWFILEVTKVPRMTSRPEEVQTLLASLTVSVYDSTMRKWLGRKSTHRRVLRRKPTLTKKITKAHLTSAENIWINPKKYFVCCQKGKLLAHYIPPKKKIIIHCISSQEHTTSHVWWWCDSLGLLFCFRIQKNALLSVNGLIILPFLVTVTVLRPLELWTNESQVLLSWSCTGSSVRGN